MPQRPLKGSAVSKRRLTCWKATLSVDEISKALKIAPQDVIRKFRDGRITSWFAEIWGERLFSYKKHASTNFPGSDASIDLGAIGPFEISVRSLTDAGIKFQKSANIGSGRRATKDDVYDAIEGVERVVVVDIRSFPDVTFIPLNSKWLLRQARDGKLSASGLKPVRFYDLLRQDFEISEEVFDLSLALSGPALGLDTPYSATPR
jgi:hypothetical protein